MTVIAAIFAVMGDSQALKAAVIEDLLSATPPIAFLIGTHFDSTPPNPRFPYGYHRATSIAFLAAAGAVFVLGAWILWDSVSALLADRRPQIGETTLFGHQLWTGWLMIAALVYSGVPPIFIARIQARNARKLHDKVRHGSTARQRCSFPSVSSTTAGCM